MSEEEATRRIQQLLEENNRTEMKRRALAIRVRELEATILAIQSELIRKHQGVIKEPRRGRHKP